MRHLAPIALVLLGCGSSQPWRLVPSPARGTPPFFTTADSARAHDEGCRANLTDPTTGVRLSLVRSIAGAAGQPAHVGDYAVTPEGVYGVRGDQLLRVDCDRNSPIGIVKGE